MHLLQSARVARENGLDEKVIMACLLHDIAIAGLLSANLDSRRTSWGVFARRADWPWPVFLLVAGHVPEQARSYLI
jgi:hypothetical protein